MNAVKAVSRFAKDSRIRELWYWVVWARYCCVDKMHVDVTGDDNARREARRKERDVNTVPGAAKYVIYTIGPLFHYFKCCDAEKTS